MGACPIALSIAEPENLDLTIGKLVPIVRGVSSIAALSSEIDAGPMGRFASVRVDPNSLNVIAQRVAGGETLRKICAAWQIPHGATLAWLMEDESRFATYRNALVAAGFAAVDEAREIADGLPQQAVDPDGKPLFDEAGKPVLVAPDVVRDKLRCDVRRFSASKHAPEFFGERLDIVHTRALPSEESLMAQLDALIAGRPGLLDALLERRARLAQPVTESPQEPAA